MPNYRYEPKEPTQCQYCRDGFEIEQSLGEKTLEKCPECGEEVMRVISPVGLNLKPSTKSVLSSKNLKKHGFKRLEKSGDGRYIDTT